MPIFKLPAHPLDPADQVHMIILIGKLTLMCESNHSNLEIVSLV